MNKNAATMYTKGRRSQVTTQYMRLWAASQGSKGKLRHAISGIQPPHRGSGSATQFPRSGPACPAKYFCATAATNVAIAVASLLSAPTTRLTRRATKTGVQWHRTTWLLKTRRHKQGQKFPPRITSPYPCTSVVKDSKIFNLIFGAENFYGFDNSRPRSSPPWLCLPSFTPNSNVTYCDIQ